MVLYCLHCQSAIDAGEWPYQAKLFCPSCKKLSWTATNWREQDQPAVRFDPVPVSQQMACPEVVASGRKV